MGDRWMTCEEVAELEGKSVRTIQTRCSRGQLPSAKMGKSWVIDRAKYEQLNGLRMVRSDNVANNHENHLKNVLAFCNNKGGVGKSTCSVMFADRLADFGYRVLLVDMDPQGNSTSMAGLMAHEGAGRPGRGKYTHALHDVMRGKIDELFGVKPDININDVICPARGFFVLPCDIRSERIKYWLLDWAYKFEKAIDIYKLWTEHFPFLLRSAIGDLKTEYDYIIIDTPPEMGWATENALMVATDVIIPIELGILEIIGLDRVFSFITNCTENNPHLSILGIIISRYGPHLTKLDKDIEAQLRSHPVWSKYIFDTIVYKTLLIREATTNNASVFDSWRRGLSRNSMQSIEDFTTELILKLHRSHEGRESGVSV